MKRTILCRGLLGLLVAVAAGDCLGWNPPGHQAIGLAAWSRLTPAVKAEAARLLRDHPRFEPHFLERMPPEVWKGSTAEQDQWLVAHAGCWPDQVRSADGGVTDDDVIRYNRPLWHYVNLPVFLTVSDQKLLEGGLTANVSTAPPVDLDRYSMNVMQAIQCAEAIVANRGADRAERSVRLCWLVHLIADCHQPCHGGSLYSSRHFPEGDKGASDLKARGDDSLHGYWDAALLKGGVYNDARRLALDLGKTAALAEAGARAAANMDVHAWLVESQQLAAEVVYTPHVREQVSRAKDRRAIGPLNPPREYDRQASRVARTRGAEAAARLAVVLERALGGAPSSAPSD